MAFRDTLKKYRESQGTQTSTPKPTQTTSSSSGGGGFRDALSKYRESQATVSLQGWTESSINLINDIQEKSRKWHDEEEYKSRFNRVAALLAQADEWRKQYAGNDEAVSHIDSVVSALTSAKSYSFSNRQFFSKFKDEEDYKFVDTHSTPEKRQAWYEQNNQRIAELEAEKKSMGFVFPFLDSDWDRKSEIDAEIERLQAENRNYERGNYNENGRFYGSKVVDDHYKVSQNSDFATTSAKRDYKNPTREDFQQHDAYTDSSTWYYDANNVYRDAYGNALEVDESGNWVNPKAKGFRVEDKLGLYLSATDEELEEAAGTTVGSEGSWASIIKDGMDGSWKYLEEDEKGIYYTYLGESQEKAYKYLADMKTELNRRQTLDEIGQWDKAYDEANLLEKIAMNAATIPTKFVSNVAGTIENTAYTLAGEDINPYSAAQSGMHYSQTVRGNTAEELDQTNIKIPVIDFTLGDVYQTGMSRLDSALATSVFGGGGTIFLGMGAAQEEAYRLYQQGASAEQVTLGAFAAGAAEVVFEYVSFDKLVKIGDVDTIWKWVKSALIQGGIEASEETFTEVSNIITNAVIMGQQSDLTKLYEENGGDWFTTGVSLVQQTAQAAFGGFIGGIGAGFTQSTASYADTVDQYRDAGRTIRSADGGAKALENLAMNVAGATEGRLSNSIKKQAGKVSGEVATGDGLGKIGAAVKNFSRDVQAGRLYNAVQTANNLANASANQADIAKSLQRKGFNAETASDIATALVARFNGKELTKAQAKLLKSVEGNKVVSDAISNIMTNELSTMGQRSQNIRSFQGDIARGVVTNAIKETIRKNTTAGQFTPTGEYEVSDKGKAIDTETGDEIDIKGVSAISKGKMVLELADGTTIDAKSVSFASNNDALVYEAIANLGDNISAENANKLIAKYDGSKAEVFARGITQAYTYGFYGIDRSELTGENALASELTKEQRNYAYGLGEQYRSVKDTADKAKARAMKAPGEKGVFYRDKNGNATDIRSYLKQDGRVLNEMQTTGIEFMEKMSKMMGVRFNVFEGWEENGTRYYLNENGEVTEGNPNGFYDPKTGEIYIDLFAGNDFQGTMLFTVAHELTHFMRQWSPEHFTKISKLVFSHAGFKGSVSSLVADKMNGKRKLDYDTALEEVVADGMETILKDGKVAEFMVDVKKTDSKLWAKLKEWFKNFAEFLKKMVDAYSGQSAQTVEGQKVADFSKKLLNQIEQIWAEGAVSAGENYQGAIANTDFQTEQENTTEDGGVKLMSREDSTRIKAQIIAVSDQLNKMDVVASVTTDGFGGMQKSDIAKSVEAEYAKFGKRVDRQNFGIILLEFPQINKALEYLYTDGEKAALLTVPRVLKRGIIADMHTEHKERGVDSITFAAPVEINGIRGNVGVVVQRVAGTNRFKTLRILLPNGKAFEFVQNKEADSTTGSSSKPKGSEGIPIESASKASIRNESGIVKNESAEAMDIEVDENTESVSPAILKSERTWTESDYVQEREKAAKEIAKAIGVSEKKAKAYIDSVNSIAKMIAEDRVRLDYFSSPGRSSFVSNVEYGGSFDFSTLCKKRRLLTGTFTAIQKALPNTALTADEILDIRNRMKDKGLEVSCGLCYVEGSRANMGQFAKEFLKLYKQYYPDAWQPNMADVNTPDGIEWVRINHPECYEQYEYFWNHYGTLKPGDKNLFASQQKPKLYQLHTEYKGEILDKFNDDDNVEEKNLNGGIRLQSFSDFEIVHLIDTMQIIMDMSRVGLAGQAYTKVPDFAWALGDTGLKINLSLIAKGVDENGKLIFDDVEGMPIDTAVALRNRYSKNVGTILVAFNDEQLLAAMSDDRVDFIIPFHRSQWKKSQYGAMGLPAKTKDYTYMQNEKFIKPQYHEYRGRMVKDKATNYMPNEYWDFSKSGKENAEAYLEMCARNNKRPKFYKLLQNNGDGSYSLKADGSTDGYWKLLIDFKMYDNSGKGSPQMPVKPDFNMEEATRMLNDYSGGHSNFPVAQDIVDDFVKEYKDSHKGVQYSDRDNAPTFYSQMAKVVDGLKDGKYGATSLVSTLTNRGVKAEEIKWSGIEEWLAGKKSVTKAELQEFIAGSMLQIEEEVLDNKDRPYTEEQQKRLDEYEAKRDEVAKRLADEWKKLTGEEFPIHNAGAGLESSLVNKIIDANRDHKDASFEGRLLKKLRKDLEKVISNNDDFGFDSWKDALRSIHRHRKDFINSYEMSTNDKAIIVKYCNALNAYNELPNKISEADTDRLRSIARETDPWNRKIMEVKQEHNEEEAKYMTNWREYSLSGGKNYREMLFRIPGSSYTNEAMMTHWKERKGVLAHARVQDMDTFIGKMLFIEEIQSDWHNAGRKDGYRDPGAEDKYTLSQKMEKFRKEFFESPTAKMFEERISAVGYEGAGVSMMLNYLLDETDYTLDVLSRKGVSFTDSEKSEIDKYVREYGEMNKQWENAPGDLTAPDAPFKETYHEYVLKRLIREAAEQDYDSIGWTTAETQDDRWQNNMPHKEGTGKSGFLKAYTIEYDQNIRKFMKDFGKKWGTKVGKTTLDNGTEVWSMAITDSMKESVMTEGQPLYSDRILMGSLFSGGGTLEAGLAYQMLDKQFGVEYDGRIASVYADNHGDHIQVGKVEDFDISKYDDIFYLHASPVCHNFSKAKHGAKELQMDIDSAKATAKHLETAMPQVFTVENAPGYRKSESLKIITDKLTELGYKWDVDVYNSADYGSATSRNRVILRAVKDGELPPKPTKQERTNSWDKVTRGLWDTLPKATLRPSFISAIENTRNLPILDANGKVNVNKPLLILTTTSGHMVTYCWEGDICPTLTTKCGEARLVMPDGNIYAVTPEFMGRIQGLPDDYKYPKEKTRAFTIIGNGIPTHLTKAVVGGVLDSAYEQTHDGQVLYQDRADDSVSNRALLANAFEGIAKPEELPKIQEYKDKVALINAEEKKLRELNEQIKELSFAKGPRDNKRIKALRFDAVQAANRINTYDKQLLRLEASAPLQKVLNREKRLAYKKAEQRGKEALADYKAKVEAQQKETAEKWRDSRKTAVAKARETAEKRDARAKLQKLVLDTVNWISYPAKTDVKCPDILKKPYEAFLQGIDLSSKRLANGGEATKNDLRFANAMDSLATAIDRVMLSQDPSQDVDKVLDIGYLDLPADFVQKLRDMTESIKSMMVEGEYVVNTMTAEEVRKLSQMIRTLNHAIKTMSNLYANLRFANVEALGFDTMDFLDAVGEIEKTGGMKDFVQWDNALPFYAFKRFGNGGESIFEGLMDAQDKLAFLAQGIFDFQEKTWTGKEAKEWSEDTHTITLPNGTELTLTTADAMSIYCLSRREQALPHLLGGGIRVMGIQKGSQKAKDSRSLLTIEDVQAIISSLTDRQKQVAEGIQEFMSTVCSEWGNEISMKRFLTREFTEKFYFPIESNDENLTVKDPAAQQSDLFRLLNISATKPLTQGANNEVIIRNIFDVFTGHASDMARLNAYGMGLLDYMKWLNYREKTSTDEGQIKVRGVRKSMEKAYGKAANSYVLNLIKDVNGRASDSGDPTILMKWMRSAKTASVGSSLRVATLQITSYPRAALVLSPKSLSLGLTKVPNISRAKKYCGIALWKSFGFYDTNISRSIEDQMKGVKDVKQKLIELSLKGAEWGDAITWGALWNACEYEVAKTTTNKVGSEEFYQEVGKKLREVVYRTQVVDSNLTRSQIMRSKRGMAQEAAAFMSEPTLSANILMDAGFEFSLEKRRTGSAKTAWKKTGTYIGRAIAVYSIGQLTAALMEGLWDAWRDEDDEEFWKKYLSAFAENLALDLVPFNKIPIVSDVFEGALSIFGVGFYSSDKMSTTWLTQAVSAVDAWKGVFGGNSSATVYNALYKTLRALSSCYGVSFSGLMREGVALWNNTAGAFDPMLKILTYGRSQTELGDMLLDAIIAGNDRQADSIMDKFADEEASQSALRTTIKNRLESGEIDNGTANQYLVNYGGVKVADAYWMVKEWSFNSDTGDDFGKYDSFYTAVETGKDLKTVIKEYTDNGVTAETLKTQITDHFKPLYIEMSNSEKAGIKGYLLNAMTVLGMEREDAEEKVQEWEFESKYGFSYSDRAEAYKSGKVSEYEMRTILAEAGNTEEEVNNYMRAYNWMKDNPQYGLQVSDVLAYTKPIDKIGISVEESGIEPETFVEYRKLRSKCKGVDSDGDGSADTNTVKNEVLVVIDNLPISKDQKDVLYHLNGWSAKNLWQAPWL